MPERKECLGQKEKVYLAGQWNQYDNNWKREFDDLKDNFDFYDPEINSNQTSADTYFTDDLKGVMGSGIMIANPGIIPAEATWIEIGVFYRNNVKEIGERCNKLIIIWKEDRNPKWAIEFIKKAGIVVSNVSEAKVELRKLIQ
jgi:hypothetical protein